MTSSYPTGTYQELQNRVVELEECLRQTRKLVSRAAAVGFDEESVRKIYANNGAITRLVAVLPEEREAGLKFLNDLSSENKDDLTRKCKVISINSNPAPATNCEFEVHKNYDKPGADIFDQQVSIPGYDPTHFYIVECGGVRYDIDRIGWSELP
jgi:hypothetical protein